MSEETDSYLGQDILEHRYQALLQTFIERRIIEQRTVDIIVEKINTYYTDGERVDSSGYIRSINSAIISLNLQLKDYRASNKHFWCLVNLKPDESSKLTTNYNANETTLFKLVMEVLIAKGGEAKSSECVDLAPQAEMTLSKAEMTLVKFKEDGWLKDASPSTITLTERAILDLSPLLADLAHCQLCKQIVLAVAGAFEECMNCQIRLHGHCASQYLKKTVNCPSCKQRFK